MRGLRIRSRSCRVAWLVSGMRLERHEVCLLGECGEGDGCGKTYGLLWLPGKHVKEKLSTLVGERVRRDQRKRKTYELVINPTNNSLNRRTQHLMQSNMSIVRSLRNHLRIHHRLPFQHIPNPPLPTDVFPESVCVEGVRGDVRVVRARVYVWTRVEEHKEVGFEDSAA